MSKRSACELTDGLVRAGRAMIESVTGEVPIGECANVLLTPSASGFNSDDGGRLQR
jgi:hypothetical protein